MSKEEKAKVNTVKLTKNDLNCTRYVEISGEEKLKTISVMALDMLGKL